MILYLFLLANAAAVCAMVPGPYQTTPLVLPCEQAIYVCWHGDAAYMSNLTWAVGDTCTQDRIFRSDFQ